MSASLPDNAELHLRRTEAAAVPSLIQGMRAGAAALFVRPLILGSVVEHMRQHPFLGGGPGPRVDDGTLNEWLQTAHLVERAYRTTLAWLRSRLPGYPILRVPQLAPGTYLTTQFFTSSIVWLPTELADGHQFDSSPRHVPELLGATPAQATALHVGTNEFADTLKATPEWDTFDTARQELTDADRAVLQTAKQNARRRLEAIDGDAQDMFQHDVSRRQQVREAIEELDGTPRVYCEAFDAINILIEVVAGDVFGQLVAYGDPKTAVTNRIDFPEPGVVHVVIDDPFDYHPGDLVRIADPLVTDALRVEGSVSQWDVLGLKPSTLTLRILDGTSVWFSGN